MRSEFKSNAPAARCGMEIRNQKPGAQGWQRCFEAGMTAREAARVLGRADSGAYSWSCRRGLKWPDDRGSPVAKGDKVFQSGAEAAKHLGAAPNTISYHLSRHGNLDRLGARDRRYKGGNKKPITIGPETYPSQAAAARALGTHEAYLSRLIKQGRLDLLIGKALRKGMARDAAALKARLKAETERIAA